MKISSIIRQLYYFKPRFDSEKPNKDKKKKKKKGGDEKPADLKQSDTIDNEKLINEKRAYAEEAEAKKTGKSDIKVAFESVLGAKKAKFDKKTWGVLKLYLCCRVCVRNR